LSEANAVGVKADAEHIFAAFADEQYQRMSLQIGEMDRLEAWSLRKEQEVRTMDKRNNSTQSASARRDAQVQSQQDLQAVESFRQLRKSFLDTALEMFAASLSTADKHNDCIFRLTALWLENSAEPSINHIAQRTLHQIPTYKFIPLIHQLSARLASSLGTPSPQTGLFQEVLSTLLLRLCTDHPFHSLFQVYFLKQGVPSGKATLASRRLSASNPELSSQIRRAEAVNDIVQSLRKSPHLRSICQQVEVAMAAYIEWANVPPDAIRAMKKKLVIPSDQPILKLHNLSIPITTMNLEIDKTCQYDPSKMACIAKFKTSFSTAGGIHLPKITDCMGTDGKAYTQLVRPAYYSVSAVLPLLIFSFYPQYKGGDDVRQDAVMQQIFAIANDVLARDDRTKSRSLAVRTYKVLPLTTDAGLLEFVKNSTAIGSWLVPAHE
jgi:ataxia telangiectasia mutated family protein